MSTGSIAENVSFTNLELGRESSSHLVQFYEDPRFMVESIARHFNDSLAAGDGAVIVATEAHREGIQERLTANGWDLAALSRQGRFLALDAGETLAKLCVGDLPDASRFEEIIAHAIVATSNASPSHFTRAFGEMVAILWSQGRRDAAIKLEQLWSNLGRRLKFSLCCAYPMTGFSSTTDSDYLTRICAEHSHVIPAESFTALTNADDRQRNIAYLQQKAALLESEMAVRKKIEADLRNKIAELADSDRRKNEFLAMLGHELRNPLSAILNAITAADLDESSRARAMEIARRQTVQLARLVDDLLDVARITQGRIALRKEPIGVVNLLDRSIEEARASAELRQLRLVVITPPDTHSIQVDVDAARMQQSISNLIHNAIKFTPAYGRVEVAIRRRGGEVAIRVRDTGIGIAAEMLPRIFDLFAQGDVSIDRAQGGLGIGLTLVRKLVAMHGGSVEARSAGLGRGSEFEITLPIMTDATKDAPAETKERTRGTSRVLIVEDNRDAADSMQMLLALLGHQVRVAEDGFGALDILAAHSFDAILVDIGLPAMDGYTLAGRIRALPQCRRMRLIALTGYGQEEDRRRALEAGFDQHLVKPVDIDRLQALLAQASTLLQ